MIENLKPVIVVVSDDVRKMKLLRKLNTTLFLFNLVLLISLFRIDRKCVVVNATVTKEESKKETVSEGE